MPPACRAWGDASSPAGASGAPRSHPKMTSEIVNRTVAIASFWRTNHLVAKALHLADNGRDKLVQPTVDGIRADHSLIKGIRDESEQSDRGRVAADQPRRVKQIRNPDLVGRQAVAHRIDDIRSVESDQ
jgi:hypothetical protein